MGEEMAVNSYRVICWIATLVAIVGAFFLGFYACGGYANIRSIVGIAVITAVCLAPIARWFASSKRGDGEESPFTKKYKQIQFAVLLLVACLIVNAIGWVSYYAPNSFEGAYREFQNGLVGERCG